jgi:hypothetical protein
MQLRRKQKGLTDKKLTLFWWKIEDIDYGDPVVCIIADLH